MLMAMSEELTWSVFTENVEKEKRAAWITLGIWRGVHTHPNLGNLSVWQDSLRASPWEAVHWERRAQGGDSIALIVTNQLFSKFENAFGLLIGKSTPLNQCYHTVEQLGYASTQLLKNGCSGEGSLWSDVPSDGFYCLCEGNLCNDPNLTLGMDTRVVLHLQKITLLLASISQSN